MPTNSPDERLIALEMSVSHLQHEVEQMHEVMLAQQEEISALRRDLQRVNGKIDHLQEPSEPGDALDERPPHY
ncbi:MAG: SlyX family protein [Planctomycetaceae bacterium]|nr:SlyX family protein [Planctomycetaceae bacterium]MBT6155650.1 SlyX family protein [Planctomycetaceae bacterium]MBT6486286.1 SlyX family protein [Planctomycetaceae bacterium]MBT6494267.1 SlyX family protein [Planctomycetaceae bacterium]